MMNDDKTVKQHVAEIGKGLLFITVIFISIFFVFFSFSKYLTKFILDFYNLNAVQIVALTPIDMINSQMYLSLSLAIVSIIPVFLIWLYKYVKDCYENSYLKMIKRNILYMIILAFTGFFMGVTWLSKLMLSMLQSYSNTVINIWSIGSIIHLMIFMGLTLALISQIIILMPLLGRIGLINTQKLKNYRWLIIIAILVISAIITPTGDIISQLIFSAPLYLCIELGFLVEKIQKRTEVKL